MLHFCFHCTFISFPQTTWILVRLSHTSLQKIKTSYLLKEVIETTVCSQLGAQDFCPDISCFLFLPFHPFSQSCAKSLQSCPTLCNIHGILKARILERDTMLSSRGIVSTQGLNAHILQLLQCRQILYHCTEPREKPLLSPTPSIIFIIHSWKVYLLPGWGCLCLSTSLGIY